eukprot:10374150-Alexandrium_andersonii.AAC.1
MLAKAHVPLPERMLCSGHWGKTLDTIYTSTCPALTCPNGPNPKGQLYRPASLLCCGYYRLSVLALGVAPPTAPTLLAA